VNLQGMSFAHNACEKIIKTLLNLKEGDHGIYFMSDNLFVFNRIGGKVQWGSFDVSKMEGSHDTKDLK